MKATIRKVHRWLGLVVGLQIIAWMASGLYFSLFPIEEIRGEHLTRGPERLDDKPLDERDAHALAGIRTAIDRHLGTPWVLEELSLVRRAGALAWRVEGRGSDGAFTRLVSVDGFRVWPPLGAAEARRIGEDWLAVPSDAGSAEWVTSAKPDSEIRGRRLPLWRVSFERPEHVSLYIDPWTAELVARRTGRWRVFDFLWMLHVMDFESRDDFNHPVLQVTALLGLLVAMSGVLFWFLTTRVFRRRSPGR